MTKHRLDFFSDAVFAIVLTLLVLDLRVPHARGTAALAEIAPALAVHAASFLIVGVYWMWHHNVLSRVTQVNNRTLVWNLLALFFVTLAPFAAMNAAERPLEPLGASLMAAITVFYFLCLWATGVSVGRPAPLQDARLAAWHRRRVRIVGVFIVANAVAAAASWATPWFGYAITTITAIYWLVAAEASSVERRLGIAASAPDDTGAAGGVV